MIRKENADPSGAVLQKKQELHVCEELRGLNSSPPALTAFPACWLVLLIWTLSGEHPYSALRRSNSGLPGILQPELMTEQFTNESRETFGAGMAGGGAVTAREGPHEPEPPPADSCHSRCTHGASSGL